MSRQVVSLFLIWCVSASSAYQSLHFVELRRTSTPSHLTSFGRTSNFGGTRRPHSNSYLSANKDSGEDESKGFSIIPPTLNQVLFAWLVFISGNRVFEALPDLNEYSSSKQFLNIGINGVFFVGSMFGLAKSFAKIDYQSLDGLDQNSLAQLAGEWAVNNVVPDTYEQYEVATFAGGCFWGTELHYQRIPGVIATCVGYTQGAVEYPNYDQVGSGSTGHAEGIQLTYDPTVVSYKILLNKLFTVIDPTLLNQVGNDRGTQYRHGIYYHTDEQLDIAKQLIAEYQLTNSDPIVTELNPSTVFWPAEKYHQRYLEKGGQSAEKQCEEKVRCYG